MTKVVSALVDHRSDPGDPGRPDPEWTGSVDDETRFVRADDAHGADADADGVDYDESGDVEQETSYAPVGRQRADFGRHFEAHYPRLVAQLYAITLDAGQAHDVVQEAYARAWRKWDEIGRRGDPVDWVRRVAVSTSMRSWSSMIGRVARRRRPPEIETMGPRAAALVGALQRITPAERRAIVLHHMVGMPVREIADVEGKSEHKIEARLTRARLAVTEDMGDVFLDILGAHAGDARE